jgi:ABC-type Fe3+/spermidine/putrescine transport system ATPase subunit
MTEVSADPTVAPSESAREAAGDAMLVFEQVAKFYGSAAALDHIDLTVRRGELLCLLGASGSGKTTMLNVVGGFVIPDGGRLLLRGADVTSMRPDRRNIGVVFQNYALFPHMSALENVAYGLRARKVPRDVADRRAVEMLALVGLAEFATRRPGALSGGQQQRVAVARALAPRPDVLLLDEPLSNLDVALREDLGLELRRVHEETGVTTIMVTHDPQEALALGDRIAVMDHGSLVQVDTPDAVYRTPRSVQAARTVSKANVLDGKVRSVDGSSVVVDAGTFAIRCPRPPFVLGTGDLVKVAVRRESIVVRPVEGTTPSALNTTTGTLRSVSYRGAAVDMVVIEGDRRILVTAPITTGGGPGDLGGLEPGATVTIEFDGDHAVVIPDESGALPNG